jgi:hypothetical protein
MNEKRKQVIFENAVMVIGLLSRLGIPSASDKHSCF